MTLWETTILADPRTKKNHMMIAGSGAKCPYCHKPAKQFIRNSAGLDAYEKLAAPYIRNIPSKPLEGPLHIKYHFYMQTHRRVDDLNLSGEMDDFLKKCGIIVDDNCTIIRSHDGTRVFYDKTNPRTEVWIFEYKEEEDAEIQRIQNR